MKNKNSSETNYWLVIHDVASFEQEPELIGREIQYKSRIKGINNGDCIVYYARTDRVIIGTFNVVSDGFYVNSDRGKKKIESEGKDWSKDKEYFCYSIEERQLADDDKDTYKKYYIRFNDKGAPKCLKNLKPIDMRYRTIVKLPNGEKDFQAIEDFIINHKPSKKPFFDDIIADKDDKDLGEKIDFEILEYAPTSEMEVVVLFALLMKNNAISNHMFEKIRFIRSKFPDACVIENIDGTRVKKYIEFELNSSNFLNQHQWYQKHSSIKCDYVVCWEHDCRTIRSEVEVIELKSIREIWE